MLQNTEINDNTEKVVLVGIITGKESESRINEYLDELEFLVETAGGQTIARFTQKLEKPEPSTFIGSGKLQEVAEFVKAAKIDIVIFDDELKCFSNT